MFHGSQMREEGHNVGCSQVPGMPPFPGLISMKLQEPAYPKHISRLCPQRVVFYAQNLPDLVQQFGLAIGQNERSLCRNHLQGHSLSICQQNRLKSNQNPSLSVRRYTAKTPYNTC